MPIIPATSIAVQDEATLQGYVGTVNFSGAGVIAAVVGDIATVTIPGGGAGSSATRVTLAIPFPAQRSKTINVIDAAIGLTSKINVWLSGLAPEVVGSGDAVDMFHVSPNAKVGSMDLTMEFLTPFAGSLSIDYMVLT
jgi:hypothetical protein